MGLNFNLSLLNNLFKLSFLSIPFLLHFAFGYFQGNLSFKLFIFSLYGGLFNFFIFYMPLFLLIKNKIILFVLLIFFYLICIFEYFYINLFKSTIKGSDFFVIFDTNYFEILENISDYLSFSLISILFLVLLTISIFIIFFKFEKFKNINSFYSVLIIFCLFITLSKERSRQILYENNIFSKFTISFSKYKKLVNKFEKLEYANITNLNNININPKYKENEIHVLILGESTSSVHLQLYDYFRETNPLLTQIKDELYIFNDVVSPHSNTISVMSKLLTLSNSVQEIDDSKNLIQYVKKSGYKTYWISNQVNEGSIVDSVAKTSDLYAYVNSNRNFVSQKSLDANIFPSLDQALKDEEQKKFIVIHLMGTHGKYINRYPDSFLKFDGTFKNTPQVSWMINQYDNAVLYNDYIISKIISKIKRKNLYSTVLYLSDHGEDVYDVARNFFHSENIGTYPMFTIPFILWCSEKYKTFNNQKIEKISSYLNRKYMTDNLIHSVFDLLNYNSEPFIPELSIFNENFKFQKRKIGNLDFDKDISIVQNNNDYDILNNDTIFNKDKILIHRVNSFERFNELMNNFNGIEVDIVYDTSKDKFDITHPPEKTINLYLEKYFKNFINDDKKIFWIDFKNLNFSNYKKSLNRINFLTNKYKISKNKILIESDNLELLPEFKKSGFRVTYMITDIGNCDINSLSKDCIIKIDNLKKKLTNFQIESVSSHQDNLNLVNKYFENVKNIYLWNPRLNVNDKYDRFRINKLLLSQPKIKLLLVRKWTSNYR